MNERESGGISEPRRVEIHSNGYFQKGWCHTITLEGKAIVELTDGTVQVFDLLGHYSMKFIEVKTIAAYEEAQK